LVTINRYAGAGVEIHGPVTVKRLVIDEGRQEPHQILIRRGAWLRRRTCERGEEILNRLLLSRQSPIWKTMKESEELILGGKGTRAVKGVHESYQRGRASLMSKVGVRAKGFRLGREGGSGKFPGSQIQG